MTTYSDFIRMDFEDCYPILAAMKRTCPYKFRRWKKAQKRYRAFADKYIRPIALRVDRQSRRDHDYLSWDFCRRAAKEKIFSAMIPPVFGGQGGDLIEMVIMIEELCAACTGLANVIGAHYLGFIGLASGLNMDLMARISREIIAGEKKGEPVIISAAHTEPQAGSDVEDEEHYKTARIGMTARRVEGGYLLNGQKVFISNGHFATWHMTSAYLDKNDPFNSGIGVMVKTGMKGFSTPKHELKMGQYACPASVLIFEDCFVPDELVLADFEDHERYVERIMFVLGTSRVGVAGIGTGCARGAFEQAYRIARTEQYRGRRLIEEQWVQQILAEMLANVMTGRALSLQAAFAESDHGLMSLLSNPLMDWFQRLTPNVILQSALYQRMIRSHAVSKIMNKMIDRINIRRRQRVQAYSSAAKVKATDLAMMNANLALEIAGAAGLEQPSGVEKFFRDAKLLQIYEGTNQINRKHIFDTLIARNTTL